MQSRKPIAKEFKKQVKVILKDIRKHGMYAIDEIIDNPDLAIQALIALKEERTQRKLLEEQAKVDRPKADFYDAVTDSKTAIEMSQVAKILDFPNIGRNIWRFFI